MAVSMQVTFDPTDFLRAIEGLSPDTHPEFFNAYLREVAFRTQQRATQSEIIRGGKQPPVRGRLTSRTGTGRRAIAVDLAGLPHSSRVGNTLKYMALHEFGGTVSRGSSVVKEHTRTVAFGRKVQPFTVPKYTRKAHTATYPKREWLLPAVEHTVRFAPSIAQRLWERQLR